LFLENYFLKVLKKKIKEKRCRFNLSGISCLSLSFSYLNFAIDNSHVSRTTACSSFRYSSRISNDDESPIAPRASAAFQFIAIKSYDNK
jgi:hypothetical protein